MAAPGMMLVSTMPAPAAARGLIAMRRPFSSTKVRCEPRPRRLTEPEPSEPWARLSNWLVSPSTPFETGSALSSSTVEGEPCFCRSSAPITSTGSEASSGVPRMNEPVTMISSTSTGPSLDLVWAWAAPHAKAVTSVRAEAPRRNVVLFIIFPPELLFLNADILGFGRSQSGARSTPRRSDEQATGRAASLSERHVSKFEDAYKRADTLGSP